MDDVTNLPTVVSTIEEAKAAVEAGAQDVVLNAGGDNIGALNYVLKKNVVPEGSTLTIANAKVEGRSYGNADR